jgi:hypothetical protein
MTNEVYTAEDSTTYVNVFDSLDIEWSAGSRVDDIHAECNRLAVVFVGLTVAAAHRLVFAALSLRELTKEPLALRFVDERVRVR